MDREILFRGKREDNEEWVYGSLISRDTNTGASRKIVNVKEMSDYVTEDERTPIFTYIPLISPVMPETVGQYSGLPDKNGAKIFEGDILRSANGNVFVVKFSIEWAAFKLFGTDDFEILLTEWNKDLVIIGNIHDNPELIKGGQNG